ncbi:MAG: ATP-binding cassette domain-containing protein [Synergistaceae bacterium]|jgi:oligopeptide/dipeptide ABC transporter ATP-binding protein|nr:ATP-binding cassette domain-containing protein [Synergistaceae bacterium]
MPETILTVTQLKKYFPIKSFFGRVKNSIKAVDGVSLSIERGRTYGLVGETGCGKSTAGRLILKLLPATGGRIFFEGNDITDLSEAEMRPYRRKMQIVFQDPYTSLNPCKRIGSILQEALEIGGVENRAEREERAVDILNKVGLPPQHFYRFPHEFSGGQRQRIGLARALVQNPSLVVCDEPVSALDVSIQSQILNLLMDMQREFDAAYLFIAHDMSVIRHISSRVGVMYLGVLLEEGDTDELFGNPAHPYTKALLSAVPSVKRREMAGRAISGEIPSPMNAPAGCVFCGRCPHRSEKCEKTRPRMRKISPGHSAACVLCG